MSRLLNLLLHFDWSREIVNVFLFKCFFSQGHDHKLVSIDSPSHIRTLLHQLNDYGKVELRLCFPWQQECQTGPQSDNI
jgi:hypothetical protein